MYLNIFIKSEFINVSASLCVCLHLDHKATHLHTANDHLNRRGWHSSVWWKTYLLITMSIPALARISLIINYQEFFKFILQWDKTARAFEAHIWHWRNWTTSAQLCLQHNISHSQDNLGDCHLVFLKRQLVSDYSFKENTPSHLFLSNYCCCWK